MPQLRGDQLHRAAGVLLTMAAGDALGAGYEFGGPYPSQMPVEMKGGGAFGWQPGEWTDDTQMALVIAEAVVDGDDLRQLTVLDRVVAGWVEWMGEAADVGAQTRTVLAAVSSAGTGVTASQSLAESERLHARTGHTAGNGSLMRTAPVALAYLDDPQGLTEAAATVSQLTHFDPEAAEACVLWCHLIRSAVLTGTIQPTTALEHLPAPRAQVWAERLERAAERTPSDFTANGWVVEALQAAWCAIITTADQSTTHRFQDPRHVQRALEAAVRGGRDTDTVAAIAGGLLGAVYGASAVPARWRRVLHGWPGLRARDLIARGVLIATRGRGDDSGWPLHPTVDYSHFAGTDALTRHPHDDGVWLAGVDAIDELPPGVDAVVSLCRLGSRQVPAVGVSAPDHVEVWLVDSADPVANPHLQFVLDDTREVLGDLRAEGKTVLVHCVQAQSRTPTVAVMHAEAQGIPVDDAVAEVLAALPAASPNPAFLEVLGSSR